MLPIKGPAHISLRAADPVWSFVSDRRAEMIQEWTQVVGKVMRLEGKDDGLQGYYRIIPLQGVPLFVKILPVSSLESQMQSDRVARWLCGEGIAVSCLMMGYPKKIPSDLALFAYLNVEGRHCSEKVQDIGLLGRSLARLHRALGQCPWKHVIKQDGLRRHSLLRQALLDVQYNPSDFRRTPESVLKLLGSDVDPEVMDVLVKDPQVVHGDLNYGNVLFAGETGEVIFLDFEDTMTAWFSPLMELGFALERFALKEDDRLSMRLSKALIEAYHMEGGFVFQYRTQLSEILRALSIRALLLLVLVAEKQVWVVPGSEWKKFTSLYRQAVMRDDLLGQIASG